MESHELSQKIPTWYSPLAIFSKNFWFTKGSARMGQFREVAAKAKRCIFLHIENEKLILGPYEEVYLSAFSKKPLGYKRKYQKGPI